MYELIKKWRMEANMTQEELAKKLFMSPQSLSLLENGKRTVTYKILGKIADVLDKEFVFFAREKTVVKKINENSLDHDLMRLINVPGVINLDEQDVRKVIKDNGECYFAKASSDNVKDASRIVCESLKRKKDFSTAKTCLLVIEGGGYFTYEDLDYASEYVNKQIHPDTQVIIGVIINELPFGYTVNMAI